MILPLLSLTESQTVSALRSFVLGIVSSASFEGSIAGNVLTVTAALSGALTVNSVVQDSLGLASSGTRIVKQLTGVKGGVGTYTVSNSQTVAAELMYLGPEVIKGQINRVAEPPEADFVVLTPIRQQRLSWNDTTYVDGVFVASINGNTLTVSSITRGSLVPGQQILDITGSLAVNTALGPQLTGTPGGVGTYAVSPSQTVISETMYAGLAEVLSPTEITVQVDVHGPASGDNARMIDTLFFSEYAVDAFESTGYDVHPLFTTEPRQVPFLNAEQQYEYRYSFEAHLNANPVVMTPQQFADQVKVIIKPPVDLT